MNKKIITRYQVRYSRKQDEANAKYAGCLLVVKSDIQVTSKKKKVPTAAMSCRIELEDS